MHRHGLRAPTDNTNKPRMCILRPQPTTQTSPEPAKDMGYTDSPNSKMGMDWHLAQGEDAVEVEPSLEQ